MGWLNEEAESNNASMFVTDDVSHFEMSPLKVFCPLKPYFIEVTKLVSQSDIAPYVLYLSQVVHTPSTGAFAKHSFTN
jgi:hypothetical protein